MLELGSLSPEIRSAPALQASSTSPLPLQARDDRPWFTLPGAKLLGPSPSPRFSLDRLPGDSPGARPEAPGTQA